jgi:hypothetical protein
MRYFNAPIDVISGIRVLVVLELLPARIGVGLWGYVPLSPASGHGGPPQIAVWPPLRAGDSTSLTASTSLDIS